MEFIIPIHSYLKKYKYKYLALYHAFRDLILEGVLLKGTCLPSSRELALLHGLSRGTVNQVYDMLAADGYIKTEIGSGTYVSFSIPEVSIQEVDSCPIQLSKWGAQLHPYPYDQNAYKYCLNINSYDRTKLINEQEWMYSVKQGIKEIHYLAAADEEGFYPLRQAIASYLNNTKGMKCNEDDIVIVHSIMQALSILTKLLIDPGDPVVLENPSYTYMAQTIHSAGGKVIPVKSWRNELSGINSKLIFLTSSHQYPTGKVMDIDERLCILEWAKKQNALILETDFEGDFRRKGKPIEPLKVLDYQDRVAFIGTFAKTLFPNLGVAYVVLPKLLKAHFLHAKFQFAPLPTNLMEQAAIAHFMKSGKYEKHLRKINRLNKEKFDQYALLFENALSPAFEMINPDAGEHLFGWWRYTIEEYNQFKDACHKQGVGWGEPKDSFINEERLGAIFSFLHLNHQEIDVALNVLRCTLNPIIEKNRLKEVLHSP